MLSPIQELRTCLRCRLTKPISEFNHSTEFGRQFYCRQCRSAWYREHRPQHIANVSANTDRYRARNLQLVLDYLLTHPCVDCGETDPLVLEFDHVRGKLRLVSRLKWGSSVPEKILAEIARCEVRCVNCHMRRTASQFAWHKARSMATG